MATVPKGPCLWCGGMVTHDSGVSQDRNFIEQHLAVEEQ